MEHLPEEIDLTFGRLFSTEWNDKFDNVRRYINYTEDVGELYNLTGQFRMLENLTFVITPHPWAETIFKKDLWDHDSNRDAWLWTYQRFFGEYPSMTEEEKRSSELMYYEMYDGKTCEYCVNTIDFFTKSRYSGMCNICTEREDYIRKHGFFAEEILDTPWLE
jgi:hypothetical protein